jgi:hypothetical protein
MRFVRNYGRALTSLLTIAFVLAIAFVVSFAPEPVVAQDDERTYIQVRTVHVKGGMFSEYVELQKQLTEALKADGRPGRDAWQEIRGDLGTFHFVTPLERFGDMDTPFDPPMDDDAWQEWLAGITNATDSSTRTILRTHPEFSTGSPEDRELNLAYLRYRTVGQGKMDDYHDWVENSLSPALMKGGADVNFSHIVLGGNNRTWISATFLDNWAEMDGPGPFSDMSESQVDALLGPAADMVVASENRLLRYRDDLSY